MNASEMPASEMLAAKSWAGRCIHDDPDLRHYSPNTIALVHRATMLGLGGAGTSAKVAEAAIADIADVPIEIAVVITAASLKAYAQAIAERQSEMTGAELIAAERQRQVEKERWTSRHDDEHDNEDLVIAATCYALPARMRRLNDDSQWSVTPRGSFMVPFDWPWDRGWWKPSPMDRVRELVKAGALIAAEIDRLKRAAE